MRRPGNENVQRTAALLRSQAMSAARRYEQTSAQSAPRLCSPLARKVQRSLAKLAVALP